MNATKIDATLAALEETHSDDPERAELLRRTRRFKSSWIELAEALTGARRANRWRDWGYGSFEEYTQKELHLRQETVDKLTGSYSFLQRRAPAVLARDGVAAPLPSYQAIDFLRRVEEKEDAPEDAVREIRRKVLDRDDIEAELSELCDGTSKGRKTAGEITLFKSVGTAIEDLAAAVLVWQGLSA